MIVGVMRLDLRLYAAQSLKEKRSQVRKMLHRIRTSCPVSIAEVGHCDLLQRCLFGVSMTSTSEQIIDSVFVQIEKIIEAAATMEIIDTEVEFSHYGDDFN